jgi:cell division control protein 6
VTPSKSGNNTNVNPFAITFYSQARALLRTSSSSTSAVSFNGRESERETIADFVAGKCEQDKSCLYISGTPGTGKTALVNDILKGMTEDVKSRYVNCVGMRPEEIKDLARQTRDDSKDDEKTMYVYLLLTPNHTVTCLSAGS